MNDREIEKYEKKIEQVEGERDEILREIRYTLGLFEKAMQTQRRQCSVCNGSGKHNKGCTFLRVATNLRNIGDRRHISFITRA